MPEILRPLYEGEFERVRDDEQARRYVMALMQGLNGACPEDAGGDGGDGVWVPLGGRGMRGGVEGGGGGGFWRRRSPGRWSG